MSQLGRILLKGLVAILPIGLTVYLIYWLGVTTEELLSGPIRWFVPDAAYVPGMGLVAGFIVLFIVGLLVNAYVVRRSMHVVENLVMRVPVVKTVYGALRDVTKLVNTSGRKSELERVVLVGFGPGRVMGFVTLSDRRLHGVSAEKPHRAHRSQRRGRDAHRAHRRTAALRSPAVTGQSKRYASIESTPASIPE